jgi:RNase adaptor protein for sRNA GlmZ degradation
LELKPRFLESVPYAARNVRGLLAAGLPIALPEVERVFERIVEAWADREAPLQHPLGLTVHVASFSFRNGVPPDETGHGGGYVFDCRALPNPGRLAEYAAITGREAPVAAYLDAAPEVQTFWNQMIAMVDTHVVNYRERNFTDLSISFGCTGGQHRSVYFAERLARHLHERHPGVIVRLEHHERTRWPGAEADEDDPARQGFAPASLSAEIRP